jgi:flagellar export protein FliJ
MPARKFRLQSVLDYREQLVEQGQQELAVLERANAAQRAVVEGIVVRLAQLSERIRAEQQAGSLDCEGIRRQLGYLAQVEVQAEQERRRLVEMLAQTDKKRQELTQLLQDKQSLDKLKERYAAEELQETNHRESQTLDELSVLRFLNRPNSEG